MTATTTRQVRPYFVPEGVDSDSLPESAQAAITAIIDPAYRELVVAAPEGLDKSTGMTIVHLAWLELLDQLELWQASGSDEGFSPSGDRQKLIERHLRLVSAKVKASSLMLRLQEFRRKCGPTPGPLDPLSPPDRAVAWPGRPGGAGGLVLENRDSVDQNSEAVRRRVLERVARHEELLRTQGRVVASYRPYRGRRLGPFFRIAFRVDGRQRSVYLGKDPALAEEVRGLLARLQAPLQARRGLKRQRDAASASLRKAKTGLKQELARVGLRLKGYEVRGWRTAVPHAAGLHAAFAREAGRGR